jgi:hypothetical protein
MASYKEQAASIYLNLSNFFRSEALASNDATGSVLPTEFRDYLGGLDYSELLRVCTLYKGDSPSYGNGRIIETVSHSVAVIREHAMCSKTKSDYMTLRTSMADREARFYTDEGALTDSRMSG